MTLWWLDDPSLRRYVEKQLAQTNLMPAYFAVLHMWSQTFGTSIVTLRCLSILPGVATVPLLYRFAQRLYGPLAGIVAAGALALSIPHIYYSQEIRTYAWLTLAAVISMHAFYRIFEEDPPKNSKGWWLVHGIANLAVAWMHVFACFLLVAQACWLVVFRRHRVKALAGWGALHVGIVLSLLPFAWWMYVRAAQTPFSWMPAPDFHYVVSLLLTFLPGVSGPIREWDPIWPGGIPVNAAIAVAMVASVAGLTWHAWRLNSRFDAEGSGGRAGSETRNLVLLLLWFVIPTLALLTVSLARRPCLVSRYVLYSSPAACVLLGAGVANLPRKAWRGMAVVALAAIYVSHALAYPLPFRGNCPALAATIRANGNPANDRFVMFERDESVLRPLLPDLDKRVVDATTPQDAAARTAESLAAGHGVWIVSIAPNTYFDSATLQEELTRRGIGFEQTTYPAYFSTELYRIPITKRDRALP